MIQWSCITATDNVETSVVVAEVHDSSSLALCYSFAHRKQEEYSLELRGRQI